MTAHAPHHGSRRWMVPLLATALVATVGCTSAASPTPSIPVATPSHGPASQAPASLAPASQAPSPSPSLSPVASPSAKPSPASLPTVGLAPTGPWSALHWIQNGTIPLGPTEIQVFGWSGGYVALAQSPGSDENGNELPVTIRASSSHDGISWTPPRTLESGLKGMIRVETLVEGPSGLLALAYHYGDTCGGPEPVTAMWSSPDGQAWQRLPLPKAFATGAVETIVGGPAGFIALGTKSSAGTPAIWTPRRGGTWAARPPPTVSGGTLVLDGVASFADGFLLVGSIVGEGGCGGPAHIHPAIWFSADGSSWSRTTLPQASTNANTSLAVRRFGDQLLAVQLTN